MPKYEKTDYLLFFGRFSSQPFDWENLHNNTTNMLVQMCQILRIPLGPRHLKSDIINILNSSQKFHSNTRQINAFPGRNRIQEFSYPKRTEIPKEKTILAAEENKGSSDNESQSNNDTSYQKIKIPKDFTVHRSSLHDLIGEEDNYEDNLALYQPNWLRAVIKDFSSAFVLMMKDISKKENVTNFEAKLLWVHIVFLFLVAFYVFVVG